jgi:hypothetical protein
MNRPRIPGISWLTIPHKALAEQMVLSANGEKLAMETILATTSLRPHLIWGLATIICCRDD